MKSSQTGRALSPAQSRQAQIVSGLAAAFAALSIAQQNGFSLLGRLMSRTNKNGKTHTLSGYTAFQSVNQTRLAAGLPILSDAPAKPAAPPMLPPMQLAGVNTGSGGWTLTLSPNAAYPQICQIAATVGVLAGHDQFSKSAFSLIGTVPTIGLQTALQALYQAKYGTLQAGHKIGLRITGLSATGQRTTPLHVIGIVFATQEEADAYVEECRLKDAPQAPQLELAG